MSGYRECPDCGEMVLKYRDHIAEKHGDVLVKHILDIPFLIDHYGMTEGSVGITLRKANLYRKKGGFCPRCGEFSSSRSEHIIQYHIMPVLACRAALNLTYPECARLLFNGWVHHNTLQKAVKDAVRMGLVDEDIPMPNNGVLICQGKKGVRLMDRNEQGVGVLYTDAMYLGSA